MSRWRALAVSLSCGAVAYVAQFDHATLYSQALAMAERAQRLPVFELRGGEHQAQAPSGASVALPLRSTVVELRRLPVSSPVVALAERGDTLLVGTFDEGLFESTASALTRCPQVDARINQLTLADDGRLFAATNGGAWELSGPAVTRVAPGAFLASAWWQGRLWLTSRRGLSSLERNGLWTRGPSQGFDADTPAVLADCGAQLCVGAVDGLWRFDGQRFDHRSAADGFLPTDWVTALGFESGELVVGTFDAGLVVHGAAGRPTPGVTASGGVGPGAMFNEGTWGTTARPAVPELRVSPHALTRGEGLVVAGTPTGVLVVQGERSAMVSAGLPSSDITAVLPARGGGFWVGFRGGVAHLKFEVNQVPVRVAVGGAS